MKKITSLIIVLSMIFSMLPSAAFAAETDGLCAHHTEHTAECGYAPAVEGVPCGHAHDETCGYAEAIEKVTCACTETDENGAIVHTEGCGYVAAVPGSDCTHVHDEACGYVEAQDEIPCAYACSESHDEADPAAECTCTVKCGETADTTCAVCAAAPAACAVEENATAEITGVTLTVDGVTYTGAEGEGYAFINPNSDITVSIAGVNLNNMTEENAISGYLLCIDGTADWVINADGTEASIASPASDWTYEYWESCSNENLVYTNENSDWTVPLVNTGIKPIYLNNAGMCSSSEK